MAILGGILAVLAMLVTFGLQKAHHDQTGVWGPSRSQMSGIRRRARKAGISELVAYEAWLARKQRAAAPVGETVAPEPPAGRGGCFGWAVAALAIVAVIVVASLLMAGATRTAIVDRARVNCRAGSSAGARIVETFSRGASVQIARTTDGWSEVDRRNCWIRSDLLKAEDAVSTKHNRLDR